ncbi:hypothetical protein QFC22_005484 [Naganishia vaughanmartiniae]|uniref:Uncharacterized protein n=1 Tax=Naganishia vaughanmartiniae TaxID=1424756 RepID=A0ACC2WUV8_9TREE|nr:hypothetical protein QFC22_005484 [Naganishia vaughanmartiniae]
MWNTALFAVSFLALFERSQVSAAVTVYNSDSTATAAYDATQVTGLPNFDNTVLTPPAPPQPAVTQIAWSVPSTEDGLISQGYELGVKQRGNFLGFSIELSVADQIMGKNPVNLKVPFLNYLANIRNRAGMGPLVRVGGNSQEASTLYPDGFAAHAIIQKVKVDGTVTPTINYSPDIFYMMSNISSTVDAHWFFGLSFNQSAVETMSPNVPLVAQTAQQMLGYHLLGLQLSNEPDLYTDHNKRAAGWTVDNFTTEYAEVRTEILNDAQLENKQFLIGPSVCCDKIGFELDDVFATGWLDQEKDNLAYVAVQHYPEDNCGVNGNYLNPQDIYSEWLNHTSATNLTVPYFNGTRAALAAGKEMIMFETNTASCGGFAGLSDSFAASLWMADYALQMAYRNFTAALIHVGGQSVFYNPFTPPPSNMTATWKWTTGSIYYSTLAIAEALGPSNTSQVVDMSPQNDNIYAPMYAIYENGAPVRLALFNYVSDSSRASDYTATISLGGADLPSGNISVRYMRAPSVAEKYDITWANQTMGAAYTSDGRLYREQETVSIQCDMTAKTCSVPVYAPSMALVFLTTGAMQEAVGSEQATATFGTTYINVGSATVDPAALSTGNGQMGSSATGATSEGSAQTSGTTGILAVSSLMALLLVASTSFALQAFN